MILLRILISLPFLLLLVLFALSNPAPVALGLWPTDVMIRVPLSLAVLVAMGVAFLLGGLFVWSALLGQSRRARRAEKRVNNLSREVETMKLHRSPIGTGLLPPP